MRSKYSLLPALLDVNSPTLTAFFVETLKVKDVTYSDLIHELLLMKKTITKGVDIQDIYTRLEVMASSLSAIQLYLAR